MSERRQLEQQLLQAQKMEGLGRLAGSVAHDFNNVLTAVLGFSELILSQLSPKVPIGKDVDEIRRAALQGRHLTEQLLAFSRRRPRALHRLNLTDVARSSRDLLQQLVGEGVAIRVTLDDDVWPILADESHVQQILVNLAVNARDAMPTGGIVLLRTGTRHLSRPAVLASTTVPAGDYVVLAVADDGCGMSPHVVAQVFDPFFRLYPNVPTNEMR